MRKQPNPLALPGHVSRTALTLPASLTQPQWKKVGEKLIQPASSVMWWIGDWWVFGEKKAYGERKAFADAMEKAGGFSFQTCRQAGWVSRSIEASRRLDVLPWTFHLEVAGLDDPDAQDNALAWAASKWPDVTIRELRGYVRALKRQGDYRDSELPEGKWRVFYADPPWDYGNERPLYAGDQDDHYPPMSTDEICEMKIAERTQDNAILFLWTTSAMFSPDALRVVEAWGFEYKTTFVWDKIKHNMGHYNSVRHEILIVATKGTCTPDTQKLFDSVVSIERTEHSRKPPIFYEIIEALYQHGRRLELFARGHREGWDAHGHQAETYDAAAE
jgi:N6-adenosine-specific RNA methylase IME4